MTRLTIFFNSPTRSNGRLWVVDVHAANEAEGPAAVLLIGSILWRVGERLEKVYGDQAYNGAFA